MRTMEIENERQTDRKKEKWRLRELDTGRERYRKIRSGIRI